ncbi:NADPH2 dehydrogenase [Spiroplasma chinense]|uniref:NADPH2 dehydrogenase n=1 Tax=Spiroplasma chinense TaxID=216932 RepID=A0A5B9Y2D2_9MOLU|nr:hypothetical protein [Spiroplasma chinense]QEH61214.1 NADPH2 dehydrogenase [Spiroplasma chinense]
MYKINDKVELINGVTSRNRVVLPPMDTLMADDGFVSDFHIQHYGARAYGGVGTIIIESTAVSSEGRIRPRDLGLWKDEHIEGFKKIAKLSHDAGAVVGVQLNHAGAKAELEEPTFGATNFYTYLAKENYSLLDEENLKRIEDCFVKAAQRAKIAGLDFVEIHAAHGFLISELIHPQLNDLIKSEDIFERSKMLITVLERINSEVKIPVGIRFSISDDMKDSKFDISEFKPLVEKIENLVTYFHLSSGETIGRRDIVSNPSKPETKMFRIPYAETVLSWTKKNIIVVGEFQTREEIEFALNKDIPFVAVGRAQIYNPSLVMTDLLTVEEMDKELYKWAVNPWFHPVDYKSTFKK